MKATHQIESKGRSRRALTAVVVGLLLGACASKPVAAPTEAAAEPVPQAASAAAPAVNSVEPGSPPIVPYRIGRDDVLQISVYGQDELDITQNVRPDGVISFPIVGEVKAAGLTVPELRSHLANRLARYFADPEVTVIVTEFRSRALSVVGEVEKPGVHPLIAETRLLDALALAGGLKPEADLGRARLIRNGTALPIDFAKLVRGGDLAENVSIAPGDTLVIPSAQDRRVVVLGSVTMPSVVSLRDRTTVLEAIAMAKGFAPGAARGEILVVRGTRENPEILKIDTQHIVSGSDPAENVELAAGDVVYVSKSTWKNTVELFEDFQKLLEPAHTIASTFWFFAQGLDVIQNPTTRVTVGN
jgi:polysaccharide export outer membrane protein